MRATAAFLMVLIGLIGAPARPFAQPPPTYRQIVDRYRTSANDGVERMLALAEAARSAGVEQAVSASGPDAWSWEELAAAAMMHTDAGFYFLSKQEPGMPHLLIAEKLLDHALIATRGHAAFVRRWYDVVERVIRRYGDAPNAKWFAARYTDRFRDRPQTAKALAAYYRGVFAELDGCQKGEFLTITGLTESGGHLVQRYFVPAARELEAALSLDADLLDAALHLGRIRMLEGRDGDAIALFDRAAGSETRAVAYLAHLFLGSLAERTARWDAAEKSYRAAVATFPAGQSASIALAQLLDRRGRVVEADGLIAAQLARRSSQVVEPWWAYFDEAMPEAVLAVRLLRAETAK